MTDHGFFPKVDGIAVAARSATVAIGVWLMFAPAVLDYTDIGADVHRLLGPIAGGTAFVAIARSIRMLRWATVPVGVLLVLAPVLGLPIEATVNSIVSGIAIVLLGLFPRPEEGNEFGGGWRVLWQGREIRQAE